MDIETIIQGSIAGIMVFVIIWALAPSLVYVLIAVAIIAGVGWFAWENRREIMEGLQDESEP